MTELVVGITLFCVTAIIANILQSCFRYRYESNPFIFLGLFSLGLIAVSLYVPEMARLIANMYVLLVASLYVFVIICLVYYWRPMQNLYAANYVPVAYEGLIKPKPIGQIVKAVEIVLQDVAAWLIVGGLLTLSISFLETTLIFTAIVMTLHIPGIWVFGKIYGWYFLILSTILAFLVPLLYVVGPQGFIYVLALHLSGYVFMYIMMGCWGNDNGIK